MHTETVLLGGEESQIAFLKQRQPQSRQKLRVTIAAKTVHVCKCAELISDTLYSSWDSP